MTNAAIADFDALMDAQMDDIDDLPPVGVPPSGHYTFSVSAERVDPTDADLAKDKNKKPYIKFFYTVVEINELQDEDEAAQAAVDQKFSQIFSPFKKDGTQNEWGLGFLKEACAPFAAHFGTNGIGETLQNIKDVTIAAELTRRADRNDPERYNFSLKNVTVL